MCTAISFKTKDHYFGRTLDLEYHYDESVVITPRNFPLHLSDGRTIENHHAIIGIATIVNNYPLYYEASNETGLSAAGLNFPENAYFPCPDSKKTNVAPYEFIPWLLSQFSSVAQVKEAMRNLNLADIDFSPEMKTATLHWLISDKNESIIVESVKDGLKIYDNPVGVLTNNPEFDLQIESYKNCMAILGKNKPDLPSKGLEAFGLPGDFSSPSRFIKATFAKENSVCGDSEEESVTQFFHILGCVNVPTGCVQADGKPYRTVYTSCCNTDKGVFYYTTYTNHQISAVDIHKENLNSDTLIFYPLVTQQRIEYIN